MKLNSLNTKRVKTVTVKKKRTKRKDIKAVSSEYNLPFSLNAEISKNYNGDSSSSIIGLINGLPKELKEVLGNARLDSVKVSHNVSSFLLDSIWLLTVKETMLAGKHKKHIVIKENKKVLLDKYIN